MQINQREIGNVTSLDLQGRIVLGDGDYILKERVNSLFSQGRLRLLLNLKEITYMDTTGLATMISLRMAAERVGGAIKLLHLPARIHDLLVITRLTTLFDVFESEDEAAQSFSREVELTAKAD